MTDEQRAGLPAVCAEMHMRLDDGKPVVNSRDVADAFEKQHQHVLRDIDQIIGQTQRPDLDAAWFHDAVWADANGRDRRSVDMTKDGFTLLVMGWSGEKAHGFKVRYIEAFNAMEHAVRSQQTALLDMHAKLLGMIEPIASSLRKVEDTQIGMKADLGHIKGCVSPSPRKLKKYTKEMHVDVTNQLGGRCPCCHIAKVIDDDGNRAPFSEFDHFYANQLRDPEHTWLICKRCHTDLSAGRMSRSECVVRFSAYQDWRRKIADTQTTMFSGWGSR